MMKTMREKGGEENLKGRVLGRPMTSKDGKWRCGPKKKKCSRPQGFFICLDLQY